MRQFIKLSFIILGISQVYAQNEDLKNDNSDEYEHLQVIYNRIDNRDSVMPNLKKGALVDSLYAQIDDYQDALDIITTLNDRQEVSILSLENQLSTLQHMTSSDIDVFKWTIPKNDKIPYCLSTHIEVIRKIQSIESLSDSIERKIQRLNEKLSDVTSVNVKETIRLEIESDIYRLEQQISDALSMDLSSLSTAQKEYLKPGLTTKYNKFIKTYFE